MKFGMSAKVTSLYMCVCHHMHVICGSEKGEDPEVVWAKLRVHTDTRPHPIRGPDKWTNPNGIVMARLATDMSQEAINARKAGTCIGMLSCRVSSLYLTHVLILACPIHSVAWEDDPLLEVLPASLVST